jgi:aspartyl-tRNA(Asn)/glutamyl-tRNA(Gln) amidotransferase subunit B
MRSKETSTDYRYFPEPDLLPVEIDEAYIEEIRRQMPELPRDKEKRFVTDYNLSATDARSLVSSSQLADYFEEVVAIGGDTKLCANWVRVELLAQLNRDHIDISQTPVKAQDLGYLIARIKDNSISGKIAKTVFEALWQGDSESPQVFIERHGLIQVSDVNELGTLIDSILEKNPKQVEQFKAGKSKLMGFFVGQIMKETQGKANPKRVNELLQTKLR